MTRTKSAELLTLIEADSMSSFGSLPDPLFTQRQDRSHRPHCYRTYVTRLTHDKYAATYQKVVNSLRNMFHAKPDARRS